MKQIIHFNLTEVKNTSETRMNKHNKWIEKSRKFIAKTMKLGNKNAHFHTPTNERITSTKIL